MTVESSGKRLCELRVVDLKVELERRKLDCSGVKAVLVKKLEKALRNEGEDPDTFQFDINSPGASPRKVNTTSNGGDKSDDENPVSDDEAVETGKERPPSTELSDDEKMDDEDKVSEPQLSDDEKQEDDDKSADKENQLSDDEKQDDDDKYDNGSDTKQIDVDNKLSDDENQVEQNVGQSGNLEEEMKEAEMSDDQIEDSEEVKTKGLVDEDKPKEDTEMEADENFEEEKSNENDTKEENDDDNKEYDMESSDVPEKRHSENSDKGGEGAGEDKEHKDGGTPGKKLRPRIRAPSEDGNSTRTPVLKKDIKLPSATKPRQEEFIVPEQESDIYDKEKFIVQDDTATDDQEDSMDFEVDMGNMDNEDSINLTIGEDDAKFMTEEAEMESEDKDAMEPRSADKKKGSDGQQLGNKQLTSLESEESRKAKSLWVSGLSSATRATDLKHLFTKHGKVMAAKIVTNAKTPGARCYGFVTMAAPEHAAACIKELNLTELHGRLISVEPVADKPAPKIMEEKKKSPERAERDKLRELRGRSDSIKREHTQNGDRKPERLGGGRRASRERERGGRRYHHQEMLSFEQIKAERKKQKALAVDREMRELNRRKRDELSRQRDVERRNREEALRLEREREKLKYEREKIERERAELLLLERARLVREREELKRQKLRLEEDRILKRSLCEREEFGRSKRHTPEYGRQFSASSHHRSPGRHYERFNERNMGNAKREERKEHRSRSPRRRSRDRTTSSKPSGKVVEPTEESSGRKCYYCGLPSHARRKCPAMDVSCPICGKPGHFGSMCSVLGYKYPEPVYFENYKSSGSEKWIQGSGMEGRGSKSESWNRQGQPGGNGSAPSGSDRYRLEFGSVSLPPPLPPPPLSAVYSPQTPPRPPYSPIRSSHKHI